MTLYESIWLNCKRNVLIDIYYNYFIFVFKIYLNTRTSCWKYCVSVKFFMIFFRSHPLLPYPGDCCQIRKSKLWPDHGISLLSYLWVMSLKSSSPIQCDYKLNRHVPFSHGSFPQLLRLWPCHTSFRMSVLFLHAQLIPTLSFLSVPNTKVACVFLKLLRQLQMSPLPELLQKLELRAWSLSGDDTGNTQ